MKITLDGPKSLSTVGELKPGNVFEYKEEYYIKTDQKASYETSTVLKLFDGHLFTMLDEKCVNLVS